MVIENISKEMADKIWEEPIVSQVVVYNKGGRWYAKKYSTYGKLEHIYHSSSIDDVLNYIKNLGEKIFVVVHDVLYSEVSPTTLSDDIMYLFTKDKIIKNAILFTKVTVTSNYTAKLWEIVFADASSAPITVTIPTPIAGAEIIVKKIDSTTNTVTLSPLSGNIDGYSSIVMTTQNEAYHLISDGTNWQIIANN